MRGVLARFVNYGAEALLWPALVGLCAALVAGLLAPERGSRRQRTG